MGGLQPRGAHVWLYVSATDDTEVVETRSISDQLTVRTQLRDVAAINQVYTAGDARRSRCDRLETLFELYQ